VDHAKRLFRFLEIAAAFVQLQHDESWYLEDVTAFIARGERPQARESLDTICEPCSPNPSRFRTLTERGILSWVFAGKPNRQEMQLTLFTDYALRMLMYLGLSDDERPIPIQEISEGCDVSHHYMLKVANELTHLGWIKATRGRGGGVRLAVEPAELTVGDLVRHTEPDRAVLDCVATDDADCPLVPSCQLRGVLGEAEEEFYRVLDHYTLADIITRKERLTPLLGLAE